VLQLKRILARNAAYSDWS